jgi:Mg-chelatase subunit ChlI
MKYNFPFMAIVGQEKMKTALILAVINPTLGGVLIRGEKGTAKSTAVRAMVDLLPSQEVIDGCRYGCDPFSPEKWCEECQLKYAKKNMEKHLLPTKSRLRPLIELPIGATEDRLLGSLNLEKAMSSGVSIFEPGLLAEANRGILYVDEVNLLDDFLVDVLLDAAAMGRNFVEREGVSINHPALFTLIGTMNPEEGELRPQLLDRFGLCVEVKGLSDPKLREKVIKERLLFEENPEKYVLSYEAKEKELGIKIEEASERLPSIKLTDEALSEAVNISLKLGVDGHRGDLTVIKTALTLAAWKNTKINTDIIIEASELALPHRMRRKPFQDVDFNVKARLLEAE